MKAGGDNRFLGPLIQYFGNTPLEEIDQVAIDNAAAEIYPEGWSAEGKEYVVHDGDVMHFRFNV